MARSQAKFVLHASISGRRIGGQGETHALVEPHCVARCVQAQALPRRAVAAAGDGGLEERLADALPLEARLDIE